MIRSLWIAKTGMEAQQMQLDTISNNLANVGTNGFKRGHVVFEDLIYQNLRQAGAASSDQTQLPTGLQVGLGVRAGATSRTISHGNQQQTPPRPDPRDHAPLHFWTPPNNRVPDRRAAACRVILASCLPRHKRNAVDSLGSVPPPSVGCPPDRPPLGGTMPPAAVKPCRKRTGAGEFSCPGGRRRRKSGFTEFSSPPSGSRVPVPPTIPGFPQSGLPRAGSPTAESKHPQMERRHGQRSR